MKIQKKLGFIGVAISLTMIVIGGAFLQVGATIPFIMIIGGIVGDIVSLGVLITS